MLDVHLLNEASKKRFFIPVLFHISKSGGINRPMKAIPGFSARDSFGRTVQSRRLKVESDGFRLFFPEH